MMVCDHCGKRHWFKIPPRYWLRKALSYVRPDPMMRDYNTVMDGLRGTVVTRYHESAGKAYCHPCWPEFLREIGM